MSEVQGNNISVVDLFAGPGGLGEGFSSFAPKKGAKFSITVSAEKDVNARRTLFLRSLYRKLGPHARSEYWRYLREGEGLSKLKDEHPSAWDAADGEALHLALGEAGQNAFLHRELDKRLPQAGRPWLLIGGPPCQAYSVVGRARMSKGKNYNRAATFDEDDRHLLYREYLAIVANYLPPVFVMENVRGILTSKLKGEGIFQQILDDLAEPQVAAGVPPARSRGEGVVPEYRFFSFVASGVHPDIAPEDFIIRSEDYGIPQARHRVIILGVRKDFLELSGPPTQLTPLPSTSVRAVLEGMPRLRSGISRGGDSLEAWQRVLEGLETQPWVQALSGDPELAPVLKRMRLAVTRSSCLSTRGLEYLPCAEYAAPPVHRKWYFEPELKGYCNSSTRGHMVSDLYRYLFCAAFAAEHDRSPMLRDFPEELLPNHGNVHQARRQGNLFSDRFRVQLWDQPATTVTSHISQDGHYFIHPDPAQCRSLTVREAARLQSFPDNYFFEGPRTQQYKQVGNAVPPLLAQQLAGVVHGLFQAAGNACY